MCDWRLALVRILSNSNHDKSKSSLSWQVSQRNVLLLTAGFSLLAAHKKKEIQVKKVADLLGQIRTRWPLMVRPEKPLVVRSRLLPGQEEALNQFTSSELHNISASASQPSERAHAKALLVSRSQIN